MALYTKQREKTVLATQFFNTKECLDEIKEGYWADHIDVSFIDGKYQLFIWSNISKFMADTYERPQRDGNNWGWIGTINGGGYRFVHATLYVCERDYIVHDGNWTYIVEEANFRLPKTV